MTTNDPKIELPIDRDIPQIMAAVKSNGATIIKAEPGSGKTTRIPPALLSHIDKTILVIEPRRLAARLSAEYIAGEMGEQVGLTVGYQIRFEGKSSAKTRIKFITEGVFSRMIQDDPELSAIGAVVIDEFHERHIHTDVALAFTRALQQSSRPDLKLLIMSATIATKALEQYLGQCALFDLKGHCHDVAILYLPPAGNKFHDSDLVGAVQRMLADPRCSGNILIFQTGIGAIMQTVDLLTTIAGQHDALLLPLSAELSPAVQQKVFSAQKQRKIIVATNVAETSLTLPNITGVIDLGLAKIASHAPWSGLTTLDVKKVSQSSCIQRTGRAGRTAPGVCYRLYSEADFLGRPYQIAAEICRVDLAQTVLETYAIFAGSARAARPFEEIIPWFELPARTNIDAAYDLLKRLGAFDSQGRITPEGAQMAKIPLHPRLCALIRQGIAQNQGSLALLAACLISEEMLMMRGAQAAAITSCDVLYQMDLFLKLSVGQRPPRDEQGLKIDTRRLTRIAQLYEVLSARLKLPTLKNLDGITQPMLAQVLLAGFSDRIAKYRPAAAGQRRDVRARRAFNLCLGRGGFLDEASTVRKDELIIAIHASESHERGDAALGTMIRVASAVSSGALLGLDNEFVRRDHATTWDDKNEAAVTIGTLSYGNLSIGEYQIPSRAEHVAERSALLAQKLQEKWPYPLTEANALNTYHRRVDWLTKLGFPHDLPHFSDAMFALLLEVICEGIGSFKEALQLDLASHILEQLSYQQRDLLEKMMPLGIRLTNGKVMTITYDADSPPWISGKIQDFYGISGAPKIGDERLALTLRLEAPNGRPAQITTDLPSFWRNSYPKLKKEYDRTYPKHYWPDDPAHARPYLLKRHQKAQEGG